MRSRHFTPDRLAWLDQVADDPAITAAGFRVAFAISRWFNRERHTTTGELQAWPSQDEIASRARLTRRGVQKAIDALADQGHMSVIAGRGRGLRSTYEALVHELGEVASDVPENANEGSPFMGETANGRSPISDGKRRTGRREKANDETRKGERLFAHNSDEKSDDQIYPPSPQGGRGEGDASQSRWSRFEVAWRFEDLTDRKAPARAAFNRLTGDEQEAAIGNAPHYRDQCRIRSRRVCHAKTWLSERGWEAFADRVGEVVAVAKTCFIEAGTPQAVAWSRHYELVHGRKMFVTEMNAPGGRKVGRYEDTEWPPESAACHRDRLPPGAALRPAVESLTGRPLQ